MAYEIKIITTIVYNNVTKRFYLDHTITNNLINK